MARIILITILLLIVARLFWRVMDGILEGARNQPRQVKRGVTLVRDPVCGTYVAPGTALSLTSGRGTHYFCSEKCLAEFRRKP